MRKKLIALLLACSFISGSTLGISVPYLSAEVSAKDEYKVQNGMLMSYKGGKEVHIRKNVSAISPYALDDDNVTAFTVDSENKYFKAVDGVLYTKNGKRLVRYPSGRKGSFSVPDTVGFIAQYAFRGCSNLTNVSIPESVNGIGANAFYDCKKLKSVNLPVNMKKIADNTFYNCRSLENIVLPKGLELIGGSAFYGCKGIENINLPDSLKHIKRAAFAKCTSLKSISIPNGVDKIESQTFMNCKMLERVSLSDDIERIDYQAFVNCISLEEIVIPESVNYIGSSGFEGCKSLRNVKFSSGIYSIQFAAFKGCESLESIKIPNTVNYLDGYAFANCKNLNKVILSNKIENISPGAFLNCTSLENIKLPDSVEYINTNAFKNCTSLEKINIPAKIKNIVSTSFENAVSEFEVDIDNELYSSKDGVLYNKKQTKLVKYPCYKSGNYTTPEGIKSISGYAFANCKNLKEVNISDGIKKFSVKCLSDSSVENLSLPESLSEIEAGDGHVNTADLKTVKIHEANENFCLADGLLYNKDKTILYIYPNAKAGMVTFAKEVEDITAVELNNSASSFEVEEGSKYYSYDDGMITNLSKNRIYAVPAAKEFYNMGSNMKNIDVLILAKSYMKDFKGYETASDNKKYMASDGVLYNNLKTKLVDYPCAKAGSYTVPLSVTGIDSNAFSHAYKIKDITVTKNVAKCDIELYDCDALKKITVKEGYLRNFVLRLYGSTKLKKVDLPSSLISGKIYGKKSGYADMTISGWTNTASERLAGNIGVKFISKGLVPRQVRGVKAKAYVHGMRVKITWKRDKQVSGYEIYTEKEKLKDIKDNRITEADIYVGTSSFNILYIRAYKIQNDKKMYGKAKKIVYKTY